MDYTDIDMVLWRISQNIESGRAEPYRATVLQIDGDQVAVFQPDPLTGQLIAT